MPDATELHGDIPKHFADAYLMPSEAKAPPTPGKKPLSD